MASDSAKVSVEVPGGSGTVNVRAREFSTGSKGFYGSGKIQGKGDDRYQVSINIVLIGSKPATKKRKKK